MKTVHFSRAAIALLMMLLTAATAWADITISTPAEWETFATAVSNGTTYSGQTVTLANDIEVTTMVGTSDHKFCGTFYGGGHTLTFNATATANGCAPFFAIDGATFTCLKVAGTINTGYQFAAGIAVHSSGDCTIQNCQSSITINSSKSGDGTHGGFVALEDNGSLTFTNCLMDGSITGSNTQNCGGFVGWRGGGTLTFNNCLMAGALSNSLDSNSATFNRNGGSMLNNCYYKGSYTNATLQGNATSATGSDLQTLLGSGWQVIANDVVVPIMDAKNIATAIISGSRYYLYTGDNIDINYTVTAADGTVLTKGTDYTETLSPSTVQEKGDYTLTVTAKDGSGYSGSQAFHFIVYDGTPVTSETTEMTTGPIYVVLDEVSIDSRITVNGDVVLLLYDNCTLNATKGINVSAGNSLTINAQSTGNNMGSLIAAANTSDCAGIGGGGYKGAGGTITINGGNVTATGGDYAAGIGGEDYGSGGTITINGGKVTANGGNCGAGIGGGECGAGGTITISGGEVTANGGWLASGIGGGGRGGAGGTITINGGEVTATGGKQASGIGGGYNGDGGTITLSYTTAESSVYASSYNGTVSIAPNKAFTDGENTYTSETPSETLAALTGKTLTPQQFNITVSEYRHGTVTAQEKALFCETVNLAIAPDENYVLKEFIVADGNDTHVAVTNGQFTMPASDVTVSATFTPDPAHFSDDGNDEYTIKTAEGWGMFCDFLQDNDTYNRFSGKTVKLDANIGTAQDPITRMAGSGTNPFCGNFNGGGNKLTFSATAADNYCAPFANVQGGSTEAVAITISNLNVKTTITATDYRHTAGLIALQSGHVNVSGCNATVTISSSKGTNNPTDLYPAGLVSQAFSDNDGTLTVSGCTATGTISTDGKYAAGLVGIVQGAASISDCVSSVTINSSIKGDGTHGGIVAVVNGSGTITGCVFNGKLLTVNTGETATGNCAGFVAWGNGTISNCLYAPAAIEGDEAEVVAGTGDYPSGTFYRGTAPTVTNCYYTRLLGTAQGTAPRTVTAGDNVTIEAISPVGEPTSTDGYNGLYSVSGIMAYAKGITRTVEETTTFYYGQGDDVSLTLTSSVPVGYACFYTPTSGSISGSDNPYTLRMPNHDVTISRSLRSTGKAVDVSYMLADGTPQTAQAIALDGTETSHGQSNQEKWYFVGTDISHAQPLTLYGNVHLILADGCNMSVTTTDDYCIYADGHSLHIYGQTEGTGVLNARTQGKYSVIGIFDGILGIHGGNVTATVGGTSNAIYVEETTDGYALIIDRGTLTATASATANKGAGISINGGNACINGGQVEATGGNCGIDVMDFSTAIPGTLTLGGGTLKVSRFITNSGYSYAGTLAVADGYTYTDGTTLYNSATPSATLAALTNVTLQPCAVATFAPAGFCTYYHSKFDVELPAGVKARIVTSKGDGEGVLTYETIADGDTDNNKVVPAGTAVMLQTEKSTEAQQKTLTLAVHDANSPEAPAVNLLHGHDADGKTIGDGKHYKLTYGNDNTPNAEVFGWYWGAANGAAFTQAGHKAWLVLPADANARSFFGLPDDDTTSIIENGKLKIENSNSDAWYDLSGRKLDNGQWSKGIYIRGGKKVVIK